MTLPAWEEQGYHFAGMLITFSFAWLGICVAITVEKCSPKATSCLNLFAGGGKFIIDFYIFIWYEKFQSLFVVIQVSPASLFS